MPHRLARAGVAHGRGERGHEHAVGGVVALDQHAVALDACRSRHVVGLRVADERMDQQAVHGLERRLRQVLVRAVDRVARLEADDALPAALGESSARLGGVACELGELRRGPVEHGHLAGEVLRLLREEPRDTGMGVVGRAESPLRLGLLVVGERVLDVERPEQRPASSASATTSPLGAASTARQTGSAHGRPPARCMSSRTDA